MGLARSLLWASSLAATVHGLTLKPVKNTRGPLLATITTTTTTNSAAVGANRVSLTSIDNDVGGKHIETAKQDTKSTLEPSTDILLSWAVEGDEQARVDVKMKMLHRSVVLEDVDFIKSVGCTSTTVEIHFEVETAYKDAVELWKADVDLLLITNHMGQCDSAAERGLFHATSTSANDGVLMLVFHGERTDFAAKAQPATISIKDVPLYTEPKGSRVADLHKESTGAAHEERDGNTVPHFESESDFCQEWGPRDLLKVPGFSASLRRAHLSGHLRFCCELELSAPTPKTLGAPQLKATAYSLTAQMVAEVDYIVGVSGNVSRTVSVSMPPIPLTPLTVPGILNIGPELATDIGVELSTPGPGPLELEGTTRVGLPDGLAHIDVLNTTASKGGAWEAANCSATVTTASQGDLQKGSQASVDPFLKAEIRVGMSVFAGRWHFGTGVRVIPSVKNTVELGGTGLGLDCGNGLALASVWDVLVQAFVDGPLPPQDLAHSTGPIAKRCLPL